MLQELTAEIEKTAKAVVNEIHTALPAKLFPLMEKQQQ